MLVSILFLPSCDMIPRDFNARIREIRPERIRGEEGDSMDFRWSWERWLDVRFIKIERQYTVTCLLIFMFYKFVTFTRRR